MEGKKRENKNLALLAVATGGRQRDGSGSREWFWRGSNAVSGPLDLGRNHLYGSWVTHAPSSAVTGRLFYCACGQNHR